MRYALFDPVNIQNPFTRLSNMTTILTYHIKTLNRKVRYECKIPNDKIPNVKNIQS